MVPGPSTFRTFRGLGRFLIFSFSRLTARGFMKYSVAPLSSNAVFSTRLVTFLDRVVGRDVNRFRHGPNFGSHLKTLEEFRLCNSGGGVLWKASFYLSRHSGSPSICRLDVEVEVISGFNGFKMSRVAWDRPSVLRFFRRLFGLSRHLQVQVQECRSREGQGGRVCVASKSCLFFTHWTM